MKFRLTNKPDRTLRSKYENYFFRLGNNNILRLDRNLSNLGICFMDLPLTGWGNVSLEFCRSISQTEFCASDNAYKRVWLALIYPLQRNAIQASVPDYSVYTVQNHEINTFEVHIQFNIDKLIERLATCGQWYIPLQ